MTISSTVNRLSYSGNGSTTAFSVSIKFIDPEDLKVYVSDVLKVLDTDYTVTGGNGSTGTVTFTTAPAASSRIVIVRDPAALQETDYVANDPFPAETHERALDRLTMIAQRHADLLERSLTLSDSAPVGVSTALPAPSANEVIAWNATGDALTNATVASLTTAIIGASVVRDVFSGTGAQTAFTLSADPQLSNNLRVYIGGIYQDSTEWSLSGTTLTFGSAPPSGTDNIVCLQQESVTYPVTSISDGVVTQSKLDVAYEATLVKDSELADEVADVLRDGDVGTTAGKLVALDGSAKLPAVDGSQLTNVVMNRGPGCVSGRYYFGPGLYAVSSSILASTTSGKIMFCPFSVSKSQFYSYISCNVSTGASGKSVRMGIYSSVDGAPGSLLYDAGTASITSTGVKDVALNQTLEPGFYWLAWVSDAIVSAVFSAADYGYASSPTGLYGNTTFTSRELPCYYGTQAYGALPSTPPALTPSTTDGVVAVALKV